jgi:hypothetical protein
MLAFDAEQQKLDEELDKSLNICRCRSTTTDETVSAKPDKPSPLLLCRPARIPLPPH